MNQPVLWNDDAEQAVLSAMMMDPDVAQHVRLVVDADTFKLPAHRKMFTAITTIVERGFAADPVAVKTELNRRGDLEAIGDAGYIGYIADAVPTAANVEYHARVVREMADRRKLVELSDTLRNMALDLSVKPTDAAQKLSAALLPVAADTGRRGFTGLGPALMQAAVEIAERRNSPKSQGIPFGYAALDVHTGGIRPGELAFLAGVPSSGKTALLLNIAVKAAAAHERETAFISAEMGMSSLAERVLNAAALVDTVTTRKGDVDGDQIVRLQQAARAMSQIPLRVDDTPTPRLKDILAKSRALKAKHPGLKLVLLDFIQLIDGDGSDDNRSLELTKISYALKGLAKELECAVIATCQVDAAAVEKTTDKRPRLSMLRWSQGMREAADFIMFVFRRGQYSLAANDELELDVAKARDLPVFRAHLRWTGRYMLVENL